MSAVSRLPSGSSGPRRAIRWAEVVAAATWLYERGRELWDALDARERDDLRRLLVKSQGRPANLTSAEKRRVRVLVFKALRKRR